MSPPRMPLHSSLAPRTDWRLCSVRRTGRPVKRALLLQRVRPFRPNRAADTLGFMLPRDTPEPARSGSVASEGALSALLHAPFFAALAVLEGQEGGADWRATVAGLVTLRLVDRRAARVEDRAGDAGDSPSPGDLPPDFTPDLIAAAVQAVSEVAAHHAVAASLHALFRSVTTVAPDALAGHVLEYGHALHADSRWPLAADVYHTVLRLAAARSSTGPVAIPSYVPLAYDRLGRSLRMMGDLDGASAAYTAGRAAAHALRDEDADRLLRISEAKILMHKGNLPAAAAALDAIIRDAEAVAGREPSSPETGGHHGRDDTPSGRDRADVIALARHDRAAVATMLHDFDFAAEQYFAAWRGYRDVARRERVWVDLAQNFAEMGLRDVAREALLPLVANARHREIRLIAATNLLELAVLAGREDLFERYRRMLRDAAEAGTLPAEVAANFALYEGQGEARFGRPEAAAESFERALALAALHHVNQVAIRTDDAILALRTGRPIAEWFARPAPPALSPSVERITRVVRRVRRRAGAPRE
jgi:tetratricopeptide (TPR) repeat protein